MKLLLQPSLGLSLISRPMLGCLDQVARPPSHKNGSKQSKSTQIRVSGRSPAPKCVGFCRGILGFTRWVPCDWANCSKSGIFAPILVGERQFWPFSGFENFGVWAIARWKRCLFSTCLEGWPNHIKDKVWANKVLMWQVCVEMEEES